MGDLSTHKAIFSEVVKPILLDGLGCTGSQAICFELGNWLRDVSQFRDPYAMKLNKLYNFRKTIHGRKQLGARPVRRLLDQLFGPHDRYDVGQSIITGAFGEWFRQMLMAFGLLMFRVAEIGKRGDLSDADFQRLFTQNFTMYYPHEHLDFPPTGNPQRLGDWSMQSTLFQAPEKGTRRLLAYLDDFIDYVASRFTFAEFELKRLFRLRSTPQRNMDQRAWEVQLQDVLVALGRASHALEDFYFHSNFSDLAFLYVAAQSAAEDIPVKTYRDLPVISRGIESEKRRLFRRIRSPLLDIDTTGNSILGKSQSTFARAIFTGSFGSEDIMNTFKDAFESIGSMGAKQFFVDELESVLFSYILDESERKRLVRTVNGKAEVDDAAIDRANQEHKAEAKQDKLAQRARDKRLGLVSPLLVQSLTKANQVDLAMMTEAEGSPLGYTFTGEIRDFGIAKVLLILAARVEATAQNTRRLTEAMDQQRDDALYLASDNKNSLENVGSHSLMAKDSVRKQPLRKEADEFARFAVTTSMRVLAVQVGAMDATTFVDWAEFLRRLMCHPLQAPGDWARKRLLGRAVPPKTFQPQTISAAEAEQQRQAGNARTKTFESMYLKLASQAEAEWLKLVE